MMSFVACILCGCHHIPRGGAVLCKKGFTGGLPNDCKSFFNPVEVMVL